MDARVILILGTIGIIQCELLKSCNITRSFVDAHNYRRTLLAKGKVPGQPAATTMTAVVWDDELALKAQNWASEHIFEHNPDKSIPSGRFTVGENLHKFWTTAKNFNFDPESAVESWWNEFKDYTYGRLSIRDMNGPEQIGHYTQMAWEDTIRIGCGISHVYKDGKNKYNVVCNYGPAGNYIGKAPYQAGEPHDYLVCRSDYVDCNRKYGDQC